jgi:hypothetical protein
MTTDFSRPRDREPLATLSPHVHDLDTDDLAKTDLVPLRIGATDLYLKTSAQRHRALCTVG